MIANANQESGYSGLELFLVVTIMIIVAAMVVPAFISAQRDFRSFGDARDLAGEILLAKMRAASDFTQARAYFDTSAQTFRVDVWSKPVPPASSGSWVTEGGTHELSNGVTFGFGTLTSPPPNTQATLAQAPACRNDTGASPGTGTTIANTACIVFNSRGIPIVDSNGAPTANDAIYINDGATVYGTTVIATGMASTWSTPLASPSWTKR
jgi:type II secretory pathway pseudopilin PulG